MYPNQKVEKYQPKHSIRILTAASLFDGHDVAINVMRRIMQGSGAEVIHLGHNRSVQEIVRAAIQEDVQGIAITSYQGGHMEFFKYMYDLLQEQSCGHIKIFGGGGGVILPEEIEELHGYGIGRIFSPDDGRKMGLQGMINEVLKACDYPLGEDVKFDVEELKTATDFELARRITALESFATAYEDEIKQLAAKAAEQSTPVIGITGTGGAGKSSLVDEILGRFIQSYPDIRIGVISVDPSRRKTGGALLGDRIRMNSLKHENIFMRSLATRQANLAMSVYVQDAVNILKLSNFDIILLESSGIGQSDTEIVDHSDYSLYVMTPEYGAASQLEKIDMLDFADLVAINKADKRGAKDALRDVKKQMQRNKLAFDVDVDEMPAFLTVASQFNDAGVNRLFMALIKGIEKHLKYDFGNGKESDFPIAEKISIIPPSRVRYLSEISESIRKYNSWVKEQADFADRLYALKRSIEHFEQYKTLDNDALYSLRAEFDVVEQKLSLKNKKLLDNWEKKKELYSAEKYSYKVRSRIIEVETRVKTLSNLEFSRIALPNYRSWGDILRWNLLENVPGEFPYTAGVFPFKREGEDPTRMFAGEGAPERTNRRFHYLSLGMPAHRLSTAFDSVTLYGEDPDLRPDIYGKVGNSGVSICCLDDAKKLYSGFRLCDPKTSVSLTINGPAPAMAAFFLNAAIDQECELYIRENNLTDKVEDLLKQKYDAKGIARPAYQGELPKGNNGLGLLLLGISGDEVLDEENYKRIKEQTIQHIRGTVQADILKEDQAQNTCIFSTDFSLKLMGDMQEYFIQNGVRNFYSVSISGYHIAEAGANPITQLALTLANGFTYVEYYLSRGMNIDEFAPNLSFFFSNGIDAEYAVMGRVARTIWAKAMKLLYQADERSQKLKYHIQTSGRSLHAQEIGFNDIRTTLQALYAIYDNCNSLHTNAYDEAITTPTEESVRRAVAIQMIINHELGLAKNQNPLQGSFIIEELTELVEEAVMIEFDRITERGGVLGAMETMYQRSKIQEESLHYEHLKHSGKLPIIGVNTFLSASGSPTTLPGEVIRATEEEKQNQIQSLQSLHQAGNAKAESALKVLQHDALNNHNLFESLMEAAKYCSLGQITRCLFDVGGEYRRNM